MAHWNFVLLSILVIINVIKLTLDLIDRRERRRQTAGVLQTADRRAA